MARGSPTRGRRGTFRYVMVCARQECSPEDGSDGDRLFGPPVPVPGDASLLDRVIALSGRRPDWQPGS